MMFSIISNIYVLSILPYNTDNENENNKKTNQTFRFSQFLKQLVWNKKFTSQMMFVKYEKGCMEYVFR